MSERDAANVEKGADLDSSPTPSGKPVRDIGAGDTMGKGRRFLAIMIGSQSGRTAGKRFT